MGMSMKEKKMLNESFVTAVKEKKGVVKEWLKKGADIDGISSDGYTSLMWATVNKDFGMVETLLAHGANINVHNYFSGYTALMYASMYGQKD